MCSETFLRLPEEKRSRILNAAWEEFTRVSFADASINQIVRRAGIARGSFYQYFKDKEALAVYLLDEAWNYLADGYCEILRHLHGDIFALQPACYDRFVAQCSVECDLVLQRFLRFLRINPGMDMQKVVSDRPLHVIFEKILPDVDCTMLRRTDKAFVFQVMTLLLMSLANVVVDCVMHPEDTARCRGELLERIDIIRAGSVKQGLVPTKIDTNT